MAYDLISVDDHIIEPPNVWVDRLPKKYQEAGPHVVEEGGRQYWVFEGERSETMGLNAVAGKENKEFSMDPTHYDDMIPGCYDPKERAKDLLRDGIRGSVCFPTFPRFAGVGFLLAKDKELADLCVRAYNDWVIDEWCAAVPGLYIPMIIGQLWDPELMAREVLRCAERGARAISFPENPAPLGEPSLHTDHWDPFWRAVTEADIAVCTHVGTSGVFQMPSEDTSFAIAIAGAPLNSMLAVCNMVTSPIPERFPDIRIVLSEGGIGWVPFMLERLDRTWEKHRYWADIAQVRPSEAFRRNFFVCFIDERAGIEARERIGVENIMWECDYPHADTPWPHSQKAVTEALDGVPADEAALITHGNAERVFRWDQRPDPAILGK